MNEATQEKLAFEAAFEELDNAVTSEHRTRWQEEVNKWECNPNDTSVPNPFEAKTIRECVWSIFENELTLSHSNNSGQCSFEVGAT